MLGGDKGMRFRDAPLMSEIALRKGADPLPLSLVLAGGVMFAFVGPTQCMRNGN